MDYSRMTGRHIAIVIGACSLMLGVSILTTCLSFFIKPVTTDLNYSRGAFTLYFTLMTLAGMFTMPLWGRVIDKFGIKKSVIVAGTFSALAFVTFSFCTTLASFYASGLFLGLAYMGATLLPAQILVNNWFVAKKGTFMGLVMAFSGVGGAVFSLIVPGFIENFGWRNGYLLLAALMFAVTVPAGVLLLRTNPAEVGMKPYGFAEEGDINNPSGTEAEGVSAGIAMKSVQFLVSFIAVVIIVAAMGIQYHLPAYLETKGLAMGSLIAVMQFAVIFTKLGMGASTDKIGMILTLITFLGLFMASSLGLVFVSSNSMATICVILLAFGVAFGTVMPPLITGKMFGQKDYITIYGTVGTASTLGSSVAVPIWGRVFDVTGSYSLGLYFAPAIIIAGLLMIIYCLKSSPKLWAKA